MKEPLEVGRMAPQHGLLQAEAVVRPIQQLEAAYRDAAEMIEQLTSGLEALTTEVSASAGRRMRAVPAPPDVDQLVAFQQRLAALPGVDSIVVLGSGRGGTRLVVELDPTIEVGTPSPPVVCIQCHELIAKGEGTPSHGLCADCVESFMRGEPRA